jgi:hypothetical protein
MITECGRSTAVNGSAEPLDVTRDDQGHFEIIALYVPICVVRISVGEDHPLANTTKKDSPLGTVILTLYSFC